MPLEDTKKIDLETFDSEEEMLVALLSQDDPSAVGLRVVHARHLTIEKRLSILKELEAQVMREADRFAPESDEKVDEQVAHLRSLASSLYAQARDDFADRKEGEAIGDPTQGAARADGE